MVRLVYSSLQKALHKNYAQKRNLKLKDIPVILGWGHTTAPFELAKKFVESAESEYILPHTRKAITDAFERAGIKSCWDLDAIETHDCFTTSEYMAIDHFGLTKPGQSWQAIEEGVIEMTGKLPINPSGGLIGCGHPVGATGVRQLLDAYKQVAGISRLLPGRRRKKSRHSQSRRQRNNKRLYYRRYSRLTIPAISIMKCKFANFCPKTHGR